MSDRIQTGVPSQELREQIANLTDEGLELVRRVVAFAGETRDVGAVFDREVEAAALTPEQYRTAAVRAGFGVLHATAEQMADALAEALGHDEAELGDLRQAA